MADCIDARHFGFKCIRPELAANAGDPAADMLQQIYGEKLQKVRIVFLSSGNGVGFELFEFADPPVKKPDLENWTLEEQYRRGGVFHICLTVPSPDEKCDECCRDGAVRIGKTVPGANGSTALYFRDPWGKKY